MTGFNFTGSVDGLHEIQEKLITKIFEEQGFTNGEIEVSAVGKAGDNYIANVLRFAIESNGDSFKVVAKVAPVLEGMRELMQTKILFENEIFMYTEVLPRISKLEEEAGIPERDRLRYAKCYGTVNEEPYELIVLEDLQLSDYVMLDRFSHFTDDQVKLVLKNFAMLHSVSFGLKNTEPELFKRYVSKLTNPWGAKEVNTDIEAYFLQLENDVLAVLEKEADKNLVKGSMIGLMDNIFENKNIVKGSKYSVIAQGDSWINNIMFKFPDKETIECCMIDYQISHENSPVSDIQYMIFNCTDHESRSKHYHEWINYYYAQLDKCLARFDLKVKDEYPKEQLDADMKRYGKISFGLSVMLATMLMRETSEAQTFKDAIQKENNMVELMNIFKFENMKKNSLDRFKNKLVGLFASFVELGYI